MNKTLEALRKSQEELENLNAEEKDVNASIEEQFEKSLNALKGADAQENEGGDEGENTGDTGESAAADTNPENLEKASKKSGDQLTMTDDDDEDEDKKEGKKKDKKKDEYKKSESLSDKLTAEQLEKANGLVPFELVKSLVSNLSNKVETLEGVIAEMTKSENSETIDEIKSVQEQQSNLMIAQGELFKSMNDRLKVFGDTPKPRKSALTTQERFQKSEPGENGSVEFTAAEVDKFLVASKAAQEGRIDPVLVAKTESRLQKGMQPPPELIQLMKSEQS